MIIIIIFPHPPHEYFHTLGMNISTTLRMNISTPSAWRLPVRRDWNYYEKNYLGEKVTKNTHFGRKSSQNHTFWTKKLPKSHMEGWRDGGMEGRRDGRMEGWKDGGMEGWRDGKMEGWKDGKKEGCREHVENVSIAYSDSQRLISPLRVWYTGDEL